MWKQKIFVATCSLGVIALLAGGIYFAAEKKAQEPALEVMAKPFELVLAHTYLCGLKDEEKKQLSDGTLHQALADYAGWEIISAQSDKLILLKRENDIAPACKANGYFGLSGANVLTLFNGLPGEQDVIQTFYQINTDRMEASLPKEEIELLHKGIRVRDLAEYNSVLSTYGEFQMAGSNAEK